jgi:hypothetical protein
MRVTIPAASNSPRGDAVPDVRVCLFCGRNEALIDIVPAELLRQPGVWACTDHSRDAQGQSATAVPPLLPNVTQDGWMNWPHTQAPFDLGYPSTPTID